MATPGYYTTLPPFREIFRTGTPLLTYHKLGPLPRGVRIKGLYVSEKLFTRQLAELHAAGFITPPFGEMIQPATHSAPRIALTFDDGFSNVLRHGLAPLARFNYRAVQFLVADLLGKHNAWDVRNGEASEPLMDAAQVREWLAAGHEIGAHTLTHPHLTRLSPAVAREEIFASKKKLEDLFGVPVVHFCYPYGDYNEAIRELVAEAGYRTATTTISGVNLPTENPLELKRFTARYPSLSLTNLWTRFRWRA